MRRIALVLLVVAAAAFAQSQKERLRRALVRIQVTDNGYHKAVELKEKGAPISQLRRIRIHQAFELILSGVAISPQGEIVTTALHPEADLRVMVTMHDGTSHSAFVMGTDPQSNLALIRVPIETKDYLELQENPVAARQEVDLLGHESARPVDLRGTVAQRSMSVSVRDLYRINAGRDIPVGQVFLVAGPVGRPNPGSACVDEAGKCIGLTIGSMPPLVTTRGAYEVTSVIPA
ncbi:MAG: S1 family peptidase, partial [Planctomycetota bacterium]